MLVCLFAGDFCSYIHGIMDGEVIAELENGLLEKQTFVLE